MLTRLARLPSGCPLGPPFAVSLIPPASRSLSPRLGPLEGGPASPKVRMWLEALGFSGTRASWWPFQVRPPRQWLLGCFRPTTDWTLPCSALDEYGGTCESRLAALDLRGRLRVLIPGRPYGACGMAYAWTPGPGCSRSSRFPPYTMPETPTRTGGQDPGCGGLYS